jgi:hypothetical protein
MKRFITFTVAVLLGLVSSQGVPETKPETLATLPSLQSDFDKNSNLLAMSWDTVTLAANAASCQIYEDLTLFNLQPIRGPYYVELDLDNDANADKEKLEVHFCNPVLQNDTIKKRSLVFLRDTETADNKLKRAARLTSGDNSFSSKNVLRNDNGDISGISLFAQESSDDSKSAFCKGTTRWSVSFNVLCSATETGALTYDKFSFAKNSDKCTLEFTATHNAGCGLVKTSGFVQYLNSNPWLVAVILIAAGIATCFFGGQLIDYVYIGVPALFAFLFVTVMLSSFGTFSVLEEDNPTTGKGVIKAIVGFVVSTVAAIAAGFLASKLQKVASGILGGIAGFFLGFLLYSLVFAMFIKSSPILLWVILIASSAAGTYLMFAKKDEMEAHATVFIGAYLIIRGLSFFLGGYPNEAQTFAQLKEGNFKLSGYVYLYFLLFILLNVAGTWVQH